MKKNVSFKELIIYEDDHFLVINKPPFVATLEDRVEPENILGLAKDYTGDAQVCHRLDKDTSGALVIAKDPESYRHVSMQFEGRTVRKIYHAVVDGIHRFENEIVDFPILKLNDGTVRISREGKDAQTWFTTLEVYKSHSLVECRPITGRTHQIRIHLSRLKAPITGDETYGGKPFLLSMVKRGFKLEKNTEEMPLMKRMALHAFSVEFEGLDHKKVAVIAPYPKDFRALLTQLSRNLR